VVRIAFLRWIRSKGGGVGYSGTCPTDTVEPPSHFHSLSDVSILSLATLDLETMKYRQIGLRFSTSTSWK
jgi:hypothetical protein